MGILSYTHCCGVADYEGINDSGWTPKQFFRDIAEDDEWLDGIIDHGRSTVGASHYFLAYAVDKGKKQGVRSKKTAGARIRALDKFIKTHNLGKIMWTDWKGNPNHEGITEIKSGIFTPNRTGMFKWIGEEFTDEIKGRKEAVQSIYDVGWIDFDF